mgnify:CR=1 FL=1
MTKRIISYACQCMTACCDHSLLYLPCSPSSHISIALAPATGSEMPPYSHSTASGYVLSLEVVLFMSSPVLSSIAAPACLWSTTRGGSLCPFLPHFLALNAVPCTPHLLLQLNTTTTTTITNTNDTDDTDDNDDNADVVVLHTQAATLCHSGGAALSTAPQNSITNSWNTIAWELFPYLNIEFLATVRELRPRY